MKKKAILFGNGFNQLSPSCPSWNNLLHTLSNKDKKPLLEGIPPTLQYEQVYLTPNPSFSATNNIIEKQLKEAVKRRLSKLKSNDFIEDLKKLNVDFFLTTNYDHTFYDNDSKVVSDYDNSEKLYSIHRWKRIDLNEKGKLLYFIHGDLQNVKSIMLGLDHYGGSLAKIQNYVKGEYTKSGNSNNHSVPSIRKRLEDSLELTPLNYGFKDTGCGIISWIDTFFFCDLHIIGLSLDFSEIDIWWLLSRHARLQKQGLIKNNIYYYPTFPTSDIHNHLPKLRLLERLGVKVVYHKIITYIEKGLIDYQSIYKEQIRNLKTK